MGSRTESPKRTFFQDNMVMGLLTDYLRQVMESDSDRRCKCLWIYRRKPDFS